MIEVTVTIEFGSGERRRSEKSVVVPDKSTVLDALVRLFPVATSRRYGMERFVEAIDDFSNDFAKDHGWHFEVNGYPSNVPAERYLLKNGDWIKWVYLAGS